MAPRLLTKCIIITTLHISNQQDDEEEARSLASIFVLLMDQVTPPVPLKGVSGDPALKGGEVRNLVLKVKQYNMEAL